MANIFQNLAESFENAKKIVGQMNETTSQNKTIIVQPQLGKNAEEAQSLSANWKARESKQLLENLTRTLK